MVVFFDSLEGSSPQDNCIKVHLMVISIIENVPIDCSWTGQDKVVGIGRNLAEPDKRAWRWGRGWLGWEGDPSRSPSCPPLRWSCFPHLARRRTGGLRTPWHADLRPSVGWAGQETCPMPGRWRRPVVREADFSAPGDHLRICLLKGEIAQLNNMIFGFGYLLAWSPQYRHCQPVPISLVNEY